MKKIIIIVCVLCGVSTSAKESNNRTVYYNSESGYYHYDTKCPHMENGKIMIGMESGTKHDHTLCVACKMKAIEL